MLFNILLPLIILGVLGLVFGIVLGYASKKFHVEEDPLIPELRGCLPGANCGGCGFTGCDAYAKAMAEGQAGPSSCPVGGPDVAAKLSVILGVDAGDAEKQVAFVRCAGTCDAASDKYQYEGVRSCIEASVLAGGGPKACAYGCLGFGSCVEACQFDAIHVEDGVAKVDPKRCTACGACKEACPKGLIQIIPASQMVMVSCANKDRGPEVKAVCSAGCIGCTLCVRNCPEKTITMDGALAVIDPAGCTGCGTCVEKCPVHIIRMINA